MELNEHTRFILGRPCFVCGPIAEVLRQNGHKIKRKVEDEQAAVIHWMLGLYEQYGNDWLPNFVSEMERMRAVAEQKTVEESSTGKKEGEK